MHKPRPHQQKGLALARESFGRGNNHICLCACVSSGKTLIAKNMIEGALLKGLKVGFFSFRVILVEQLKTYFKDAPDITIGTIQRYGKQGIELDFVIFDEIDFHGSKSKNNIISKKSITLSGTPCDADGNIHDFDEVLDVIQIPELIELELAKPIKVLSTSKADTSKLKKQAGDFNKGQSFELMEKSTIKRDLVDTYKKHCIDRVTILFAIDTKHAESLKELFLSEGIECDTTHSRKAEGAKKAFENGEFKLLINVAQLTTGYDNVAINCVMFARPMASIPLFIQCVGRGIRLNPDRPYDDCLVIDCSEVLKRTSFHPMQKLNLSKKKQDKKQKKCKCGESMMILDKKITPIDDYSYTQLTYYRCDFCNAMETNEEIKAINFSFCESCGVVLEAGNITYKQSDNKIEFVSKCSKCNYEATVREILLSDKELKEIKHQEVMKTSSWEKVEIMLKAECKKWKHHHKYSTHLIVGMKAKGKTPEEVELYINNIIESGAKISSLQFKG